MRTVFFVSLLVFLATLVSTAHAGADQTAAGAQEWGGGFAFSYSGYATERADASVTVLAAGPSYGQFIADNVELKLDLALMFMSYSNGDTESQTTMGLDAQALFHFPSDSDVVPFFGGGFGIGFATDSSSSDYDPTLAVPILTGGARIFVTDSGCLTIAATYSHEINALYDEDVSGNIFAVSAGYSVFSF